MSDRDAGIPSLDERVDDLRAILDDAGIERAYLCGVSEGGSIAALFAATYPARVAGVVLIGSVAGPLDDEAVAPDPLVEAWLSAWGTDDTLSAIAFSPSLAGDPAYVRWLSRYERQSASPGDIRRLVAMAAEVDVRPFLPLVRAPALVLARGEDRVCDLRNAEYLAAHLANAELVVLDGEDHAPHAGDIDGLVAEIRRFVVGSTRFEHESTRFLSTVLFTDIVRSTDVAEELGDERWCRLLDGLEDLTGTLAAAQGGTVVKSTGDGALVLFDGPARAVRFAAALRDGAVTRGLHLRIGLHAGEVERRGGDVAGIAVHIAARVQALADPDEILVSRTVCDLVVGSDLAFEGRGRHILKGIAEPWEISRYAG